LLALPKTSIFLTLIQVLVLDILFNAFKEGTLVLTGAAINVCVNYTGADAHRYVVEEATAGTSPEVYKAALQSLEYLQHWAIMRLDEVEAMKSFSPL
jgi:hypothetical protein